MGERSQIEWTHHTFNPWWGCQRVSPGCEHCYAETFSKRVGLKVWGPESAGIERRFFGDKHWNEPRRWNAAAERAGERHRVFCASMADVFEDRADLAPHRARLYGLIRETPHLDWILLTKRPENIRRLWREAAIDAFNGADSFGPFGNIWLGTTAEDQPRADERIPHLLACRDLSPVLFVSYEPAIGPVDWRQPWVRGLDGTRWGDTPATDRATYAELVDWIIIGGESGPGARPFDVAWARSTIEQGRAAGTAVFVKQLGARAVDSEWRAGRYAPEDHRSLAAVGALGLPKGATPPNLVLLRDRKGGDLAAWPEDLCVREYPR